MLKQVPEVIVGVQWRLRRSTVADAQAVFDVAHDPEVMRYMDWPAHRSVADARAYLEGVAGRWVAGSEYHWVIEPRSGGPLVGCIATRVQGHAADFGYFVARAAWGQGVATAAGRLLVDWLERQPTVLRIWATTDADNLASARVLEKLGLQQEGVLRLATWRPNLGGRPRDTAIYARCKSTT